MKLIEFLVVFFVICAIGACNDMATMQCPECELIPEGGPCRASIPKYYFDQNEGQCKEFTWGGCQGVVPFETLQECLDCECR